MKADDNAPDTHGCMNTGQELQLECASEGCRFCSVNLTSGQWISIRLTEVLDAMMDCPSICKTAEYIALTQAIHDFAKSAGVIIRVTEGQHIDYHTPMLL